jgi:23S rRNA (uracil1939-C5)-methyltransferase
VSSEAAPTKPVRPRNGDELELTVESLAHGGAGVARLEGYVVFVLGAVPGDRVRARVHKSKRGYAEARAVELLEPSPERIQPRAAHPGAPWQVLTYERQLAEKEQQVRDALTRIGQFEDPPVRPIVPAESQWRYRNKLEYSFGQDESGELVLGFHHPGRWDLVDDVADDVLASDRINELRESVKAWAREQELPAYDRRDNSGFLRNLVVREGRRTGELQVRLVTSVGSFDRDTFVEAAKDANSILWTESAGVAETSRGGKTTQLAGKATIQEELSGLRFRISPEAFFQTNTEMAERLYGIASDAAGLTGRERVYDLYCGSGTIALTLAGYAREVWGVEVVESAIADAIKNAKLNGVDNAKFFAGDVRTAARPLLEQAGTPDVLVVDPPRAGLSAKIVRRIIEMEAPRIVYVSCNPTTLAPNARQLVDDGGYSLLSVQPVDMFPQTPHIESVALLEKLP